MSINSIFLTLLSIMISHYSVSLNFLSNPIYYYIFFSYYHQNHLFISVKVLLLELFLRLSLFSIFLHISITFKHKRNRFNRMKNPDVNQEFHMCKIWIIYHICSFSYILLGKSLPREFTSIDKKKKML